MRLVQRLWALDDRLLGRPVPDDRPLTERILRPSPIVRTRRGRALYFILIAAMFADLGWVGVSALGLVLLIGLFLASLATVAWDMRRASERFWNRG